MNYTVAGLSMQDDLNKVLVAGHKGPHPTEYHQAVFSRLADTTGCLSGGVYAAAFRAELGKIGVEIQTVGSDLNSLVSKKWAIILKLISMPMDVLICSI